MCARLVRSTLVLAFLCIASSCAVAQLKAQWVPGQSGLNAGLLPDPGVTVANITINYSADTMADSNGNALPVTGAYSFWVPETLVYYVPRTRLLGGKMAFAGVFPGANGSLTVAHFGADAGGMGYADTWIQPFTLGWHFKRADTWVGYAAMAPTGRYSPGATDNVGSGYWGHHIITGTTFAVTKKGTTANLFTDWEIHGHRHGTNLTPGQAFTIEWGIGQDLPLDKEFNKVLQLGVIGYDQWQVSENGGTITTSTVPPVTVPGSTLPMYSVHAIGFQTTFILPKKGLNFFFKFEPEYLAKMHSQGRTIAFGGGYTFRFQNK